MTALHTKDVIIIGAGTAGLAALKQVQELTDNYLLINDGPYGTTCARVGCMPSKLLIEAANAFHRRYQFDEFGIENADSLSVNLPKVLERVRHVRDYFVSSTLRVFSGIEDKVITGRARLTGKRTISVNDQLFSAEKIIVATGSRPIIPDRWESISNDKLLTTDTLFEQRDLKSHIAVIGLGAIGIEMAQALARLGVKVTAFTDSALLAGLTDEEVSDKLKYSLESEFTIHTQTQADLEEIDSGVRVTAGDIEVNVDQVLVAIGRQPNLDNMGLDKLDIALDDKGMPDIDPNTAQVADIPVFVAGDASANAMLLHEVADEGRIAGHNVFTDNIEAYQRRTPLAIVFSEPNTALVGSRLSELDTDKMVIGKASFDDQGRARAGLRNYGVMHVYLDKKSGRLLGAEMSCPGAEHMAHTLALAISQDLCVKEVLAMPIYHPVLEEGMRSALRDGLKQTDLEQSFDLARCDAFNSEALD